MLHDHVESSESGLHLHLNATASAEISGRAILLLGIFEYIKEHPFGYLAFLVFLTVWTTLALPVTPIEVCAGFVFGPIWGTLGSVTGKTLGCLAALTIGRIVGKSQGWRMPSVLDKYLSVLRTNTLQVRRPSLNDDFVSLVGAGVGWLSGAPRL